MGLKRFSKYVNLIFAAMLTIEYIIFTCSVDLIPLIFGILVCGIFVIVRSRNDNDLGDGVENVIISSGEESETLSIVLMIILSFFVVSIMVIFGIVGLNNLWETFSITLSNSHIFRYVIYGLIYPLFLSYFMTYTYTDVNTMNTLLINVFGIFLLINLFIGLIICMNWGMYLNIANFVVNIF